MKLPTYDGATTEDVPPAKPPRKRPMYSIPLNENAETYH